MAVSRTKATGSARATIDHDEIRAWVEEHGGHPAMVKRTRGGAGSGILRIDFPGYSGARSLEPISWDEFFDRFEESELAFLYQDATGAGRPSRFNKLVGRETVDVARATGRKKAVPRRWAKKGATTRAELEAAEREAEERPAAGRKRAARGTATRGAGARGAGARAGAARGRKAAPSRAAARATTTRKKRVSKAAKAAATRRVTRATKKASRGTRGTRSTRSAR
ncbi:MAG TPA: hypothetical protein VKY73_05530 [Polyangiaceae bacterium]|nr:hypothetical protein [Polyangiaceae bacterium]